MCPIYWQGIFVGAEEVKGVGRFYRLSLGCCLLVYMLRLLTLLLLCLGIGGMHEFVNREGVVF